MYLGPSKSNYSDSICALVSRFLECCEAQLPLFNFVVVVVVVVNFQPADWGDFSLYCPKAPGVSARVAVASEVPRAGVVFSVSSCK